jgi:hypothetical protein
MGCLVVDFLPLNLSSSEKRQARRNDVNQKSTNQGPNPSPTIESDGDLYLDEPSILFCRFESASEAFLTIQTTITLPDQPENPTPFAINNTTYFAIITPQMLSR